MIANVRWFADAASRGPGGSFERELPPDTRQGVPPSSSLLVAEAIGVVAAMTAYNFPYILTAWKVAGAPLRHAHPQRGRPLRPEAPWGGVGMSGIGREGGEEGLREFFETRHVQWPTTRYLIGTSSGL